MVPLTVTICGAAVMGLEMMAFRVLPPNFGSSLYVWGSIISVFLTALTLGYFFGGVMADRRPRLASLGLVVLIAGLLVPPIPYLQQPLAEWVLGHMANERWAGVLYALVLFGPSTLLLGTVSPFAVRLVSRDVQRIGNVAGRLYALSTAGSIFGTLFTAFYWMDVAGVRAITASIGWVLVALGVLLVAAASLLPGRRRAEVGEAGAPISSTTHGRRATIVAAALLLSPAVARAQARELFRRDTMYHHIVVQDSGEWRELKFDRSSQSGMLRADPLRSMYAYTDGFHLAPVYCPDMKRVLFIGGGAATGPKQFRGFYPNVRIDVVEIDPVVMEVAQRFFAFKPDGRTTVTIRDGRRFLMTTRNQYDAIIVDAYYAESIPFHVTTVEFMQAVKKRLTPGGVAIFNIIGSLKGSKSQLVRSEYKTIRQAFRSCAVFPILETEERPGDYSPSMVRNVMLVATEQPLAPDEVRRRAVAVKNSRLPHFPRMVAAFKDQSLPTGDVPLLTDDFAPVDRLIPIPRPSRQEISLPAADNTSESCYRLLVATGQMPNHQLATKNLPPTGGPPLIDGENLVPPNDATLLKRMLSRSASLLQARGCGVLLWDRDKNQITAMAPFAGLEEEQVKSLEFPVGGAALAPVVLQDRPVMLEEMADSQPDVLHFRGLGLQNVVGVPLALERRDEANTVTEREVMGICCAFDKHYGRSFDQEDAKLLAMMARQVSAVLVTSRLYWEAVQQKKRLVATLESMAVGLIAISPNGTITQLNAAARKALSIEGDFWFGRYYAQVIQNEEMRRVVAQSFDTQIPQVMELTLGEPDDRIYRVQSEPIAAEDKQTLGWVVVLEDVTDIRQSEQMMAAFVDIVSHELRTPLTSIQGFVATLLNAGEGVFDWETEAEFLGIVDTEAVRLGQMIDDLLNIARLQRGRGLQFDLHSVDLNTVIERVVRLQSPYVRGHTLDVQSGELPNVVADEGKIQQVVTNLVNNAIKYSPNGGTITISAVPESGPNELSDQMGVRLSVADQGMGIPPDALSRMFTRFFRVEGSHMSGIRGTGLGLWLIKHFIDGHGGAIWVESEFGHGSTFNFWLPLNPPETTPTGDDDGEPILPKA